MDPSETRDMRLLASSQFSSVCAQEEIGRSDGDQYDEWVLKSSHRMKGPSGMARERRWRRFGRLSMTWW